MAKNDDFEVFSYTITLFEAAGHSVGALEFDHSQGWLYKTCNNCGITILNWSRCDNPVCDKQKLE